MNENTPLLNNNSSSNSSSNANNYNTDSEQLQQLQQDRHKRGVFMKPKSLSFTNTPKRNKKKKTNSISKMPNLIPPVHVGTGGGDNNEYDEAWVQKQKEFIEQAGIKPSLKKRIKFEMDTSKKGRYWELFDAIMTTIFILLYIWNTQYVKIDQHPIPYPRIYQNADCIIACIILVQYLPHIWLSDEPLQSFFKVFSILTWLSVFPVIAASILTIFDDDIDNTYMGAGILFVIKPK
nr:15506_t:CDS:2 [Entrophospora candida]